MTRRRALAAALAAAGLAGAAAQTKGHASINCRVGADGRLSDCRVVSETPPGRGFGQAALRMAGRIRINPRTRSGRPTAGARVTIPIPFRGPAPREPNSQNATKRNSPE